jgi:hypothetical protein
MNFGEFSISIRIFRIPSSNLRFKLEVSTAHVMFNDTSKI